MSLKKLTRYHIILPLTFIDQSLFILQDSFAYSLSIYKIPLKSCIALIDLTSLSMALSLTIFEFAFVINSIVTGEVACTMFLPFFPTAFIKTSFAIVKFAFSIDYSFLIFTFILRAILEGAQPYSMELSIFEISFIKSPI